MVPLIKYSQKKFISERTDTIIKFDYLREFITQYFIIIKITVIQFVPVLEYTMLVAFCA
jgi:hypothetical protein